METLAFVVAGEVLACPMIMMLAVVYVYQQNQTMYGWNDNPSAEVMFITRNWGYLPDASLGGVHLFSGSDLKQARVQRLVNPPNAPPLAVSLSTKCNNGETVYIYNRNGSSLSTQDIQRINNRICQLAHEQGYTFAECVYYGSTLIANAKLAIQEKVFQVQFERMEGRFK